MTAITPRTLNTLSGKIQRLAALTAEYSLWLIPAPAHAAAFQSVINDLAASQPPAPTFPPHITLLSKIPLTMPASAIRNLAYDAIGAWQASSGVSQSHTWQLDLQDPEAGRSFFQSVYAPVQNTDELLALRKALVEAFKHELPNGYASREFAPHLSLFYGDVSDDVRRNVVKRASDTLKERTAEIARLAIVRMMGTTQEWQVVDSLALQTLA